MVQTYFFRFGRRFGRQNCTLPGQGNLPFGPQKWSQNDKKGKKTEKEEVWKPHVLRDRFRHRFWWFWGQKRRQNHPESVQNEVRKRKRRFCIFDAPVYTGASKMRFGDLENWAEITEKRLRNGARNQSAFWMRFWLILELFWASKWSPNHEKMRPMQKKSAKKNKSKIKTRKSIRKS